MLAHLRANLWLLVLTVLLCSVLYPLVMWGIGQAVFHDSAQGSLVADAQGKPIGSRLIAQPFTKGEYFQPRPSAATPAYNAAASGCSNWAANNYQLRDRVARQLGPIVKYAGGPKRASQQARTSKAGSARTVLTTSRASWPMGGLAPRDCPKLGEGRQAQHGLRGRLAKNPRRQRRPVAPGESRHAQPKPDDLAVPFFTAYSKAHPGTFPIAVEHLSADGTAEKRIEPVGEGTDIQAAFFDLWLQEQLREHKDVELEQVPADAVMASGSGLDPDITLSNALWQLDRVAAAWAKKTGKTESELHDQIGQLLRAKSYAPLGGLVGARLVNVLEINLILRDRYQSAGT